MGKTRSIGRSWEDMQKERAVVANYLLTTSKPAKALEISNKTGIKNARVNSILVQFGKSKRAVNSKVGWRVVHNAEIETPKLAHTGKNGNKNG